MNRKALGLIAAGVLFLILTSPFIYNAVGVGVLGYKKAPGPVVKVPGKCVEETEFMRANHMMLLMHSRQEAVQDGVRVVRHSLKNCRTCHTSREEFCDQCHSYEGVTLECFECHYYP